MPWSPLPTADGSDGPGPAALSGLLDTVLAGLGGPSVDAVVVVHERWAEVVGEEVAAHARPLGIEGGTLRIGVESSAWASHLRWSETEILARLRALLGDDEVTAVTVRVVRR